MIRFTSEKDKSNVLSKYSKTFNSIIACYDIIDLDMTGGKFIWSNNHTPPTLERLDRVIVSKSWEDIFPSVMVYKLPREVPDHNPLIFSTSQQQTLKGISFRFELSWLNDSNFLPLVQGIWSKPCHANTALDRIQANLRGSNNSLKDGVLTGKGSKEKRKLLYRRN